LNLLMSRDTRPVAFFLRTPEPVDWRRVNVVVAYGPAPTLDRRFATKLIPSPDGCACLIVLTADDVAVKVPRGSFVLRFHYAYVVAGLPTLVRRGAGGDPFVEFDVPCDQPVGIPLS